MTEGKARAELRSLQWLQMTPEWWPAVKGSDANLFGRWYCGSGKITDLKHGGLTLMMNITEQGPDHRHVPSQCTEDPVQSQEGNYTAE